MTTKGPLRRYTCDRCVAQATVAEGESPTGWVRLIIRGGARLDRIKDLCRSCTSDIDRAMFDSRRAVH